MRINVSEKGACIEFNQPPEGLTPGELAMVREENHETWRIGIVRWVHTTPKLNRLAGMEFLPEGQPTPCAACVVNIGRAVSPYLPGLLFETLEGEQVLLVPSMPFKAQNRVRILSMEGEFVTQLRRALESTFHLSRFLLHQETPGI